MYEGRHSFYATYYLARLAGFGRDEASQVAYGTQYVDDRVRNRGRLRRPSHFDAPGD